MKILQSFYILTLVFMMSCDNLNTKTEGASIDNTSAIEQDETVSIDTLSENRFAYIKEFKKLNSSLFIKVDYVDYLTEQEALNAEWRDEVYFTEGEDTITNITDGFYISNVNSKLRTFRLKDGISVEFVIDDDEPQKLSASKPLDSKQIKSYIKDQTLLFLHIKNGLIIRIDERFMP